MGRRALPPQKTTADLSEHYYEIKALPEKWDIQTLFSSENPLEIELGSGKGLFLNRTAAENPARNFIGLEIRKKYAMYSAIRLERVGIANAVMFQGDGLLFCNKYIPTATVHAVHVYFPDPWWKQKHHKRRVLNVGFMGDVVRILQPGGKLHFWTDVRAYFDSTLELISQFDELIGPHDVQEQQAEFDMDYRTHFERRTRKHNETVYRSEFERANT
ncbi:MAG: tRNA (guanosine(46)-N7)-methyltransferase TrmB [Planctomycetaceae bacterium]|jgi:tRNA (guanine-N7-)-methyltransferase|nr:tRNA (guanosine(46)-N7)-methyltransferase TrmB [Planctomycetaceae bacterium]MBT4723682.1 tRNA (guanosine(46)-N7)-methyltransferase TrmB [Planctomycetaceae bacterium]MBT4846370.1 tRNA (guanosine(46)-N7)-methyltransferase TrmB [Planctomycetaceae bacterium]MBT5126211.1 tRNA (guanosine(46)-N7)-methyltransferase TrmB [Planctomycetaceae bacterium]MBT5599990.1 tRNA (guanosine(46)-N7)-methyltransferase TrmB [Planctomycetaceae bacterium]